MGKIEDMQRQRQEQLAANERRRAAPAARPVVAPAAPEPAPAPSPRAAPVKERTSTTKSDARSQQGKCPDCGKLKPLQNGVMASHQKGFGKACSGSRKSPV